MENVLVTKKQINIKDSVGKQIARAETDGARVAIAYTDGTFSVFEEYDDWGCTGVRDAIMKDSVFIDKLGKRADGSTYFTDLQEILIKIGVLDGNALIAMAKDRIDEYVEKEDKRMRKLYLELHEKYGEK